MTPNTAHDRAVGALLGLAAGDAVGTTLECKAPGTFEPHAWSGPVAWSAP